MLSLTAQETLARKTDCPAATLYSPELLSHKLITSDVSYKCDIGPQYTKNTADQLASIWANLKLCPFKIRLLYGNHNFDALPELL